MQFRPEVWNIIDNTHDMSILDDTTAKLIEQLGLDGLWYTFEYDLGVDKFSDYLEDPDEVEALKSAWFMVREFFAVLDEFRGAKFFDPNV